MDHCVCPPQRRPMRSAEDTRSLPTSGETARSAGCRLDSVNSKRTAHHREPPSTHFFSKP